MKGGVGLDLVFLLFIIGVGVTIFVAVFYNFIAGWSEVNTEAFCNERLARYCAMKVCDETPDVNLKNCKERLGKEEFSKEECRNLGFSCGVSK
ncbi:MAG: hypothetical protein N3D78_02450 [Candidatus Aenigmarchaeota archaeon]|nr:hypothetical protein [Candidatus Aenigmarchaeota archaeon]